MSMAKPKSHQNLAKQHIDNLFSLVQTSLYSNTDKATRYIWHLRKMAMRFRLRLPRSIKKSYCKHCYVAFAPGKNCRVRTKTGKLVYSCFSCKKFTRLPLK